MLVPFKAVGVPTLSRAQLPIYAESLGQTVIMKRGRRQRQHWVRSSCPRGRANGYTPLGRWDTFVRPMARSTLSATNCLTILADHAGRNSASLIVAKKVVR